MYVTYVSELKCNYLPLTEDTESMSDRSAPWMPSCLFMRLKSTNISLKIRKSERDNEARAAAEMGIGYRRGSTAARRCHRPASPAAQTTAAGISPCKNHGTSAKIISWNIHLKTKRHSQFIQVLHNCNFYDSTICHQDAEDGSGQCSGPHVRMQLHNCPLPSIQNYAAPRPALTTLPPHMDLYQMLLLLLLLQLQQCQDPDYPYWEFAQWKIRQGRPAKIFWQTK